MRITLALICLGAVLAPWPARSATLFYAGDTQSGSMMLGNSELIGKTYEVFELGAETRIQGLFTHQLAWGQVASLAMYEVYRNPTSFSLGQLVTLGFLAGTSTLTGRQVQLFLETRVEIEVPAFVLGPGRYAFNIRTTQFETVGSTTGLNGVGPTAGDNFAYFFNANNNTLEVRDRSYSMGVIGEPVPEPLSLVAVGVGVIALLRRRRA